MDGYRLERKIARGSFADVYLTSKDDNFFAMKKVSFDRVNDKIKERLIKEAEIMKNLDHPNIVKLYNVLWHSNSMDLILEYCNSGTLTAEIKKAAYINPDEREAVVKLYMKPIKNALGYLHQLGYTHRDLKPENILLHKVNGKTIVKVADFGFAREITEDLMATCCGSPIFMAPEIIDGKNYDDSIDLWSYGVILYEFLFGYQPVTARNVHELNMKLKTEEIKYPQNKFSIEANDLLRSLLVKDPKKRITWENFCKHLWFTDKSSSLAKNLYLSLLNEQPKSIIDDDLSASYRVATESLEGSTDNVNEGSTDNVHYIGTKSKPIPIPKNKRYDTVCSEHDDFLIINDSDLPSSPNTPMKPLDSFMYWLGYEKIKK